MPSRRSSVSTHSEGSQSSRASSSGSQHRQMVGFKGDRWLEVFRKRRERILDCFRQETAAALGVSPDAITDIVCTAGAFMIDFAVDSDDPAVQRRLDSLVESCPYESVWEIYFREMANRDPRDTTATPVHNTVTSALSRSASPRTSSRLSNHRSESPTSGAVMPVHHHHEPRKQRSASASSVSRSSIISLQDERDSRSASPLEHIQDEPDHHHHRHKPSRPEQPRREDKGQGNSKGGRRPPHSSASSSSSAAAAATNSKNNSSKHSSPKKHSTAAPSSSSGRGGLVSSSSGRGGSSDKKHHQQKGDVTRHWIGFEGERWETILQRGGASARREIEESFIADLKHSEEEAGISDPVLYSCVYDPEKVGLVIECDWRHSRSLTTDEVDHRLSTRFTYDRLWDLYFDEPKRSASNASSARTAAGGVSSGRLHTEAHSVGFDGPGWRETVRDDWADICEAFVMDVLSEQGSRVHAVFVAGYDLLRGLILNADITYISSVTPKEMDQRLKAGTYERVWEVYHEHQARRRKSASGKNKNSKKSSKHRQEEDSNSNGSLSLPPLVAATKKSTKKR